MPRWTEEMADAAADWFCFQADLEIEDTRAYVVLADFLMKQQPTEIRKDEEVDNILKEVCDQSGLDPELIPKHLLIVLRDDGPYGRVGQGMVPQRIEED